MNDDIKKKIRCPRCNSEAIYRYGKSKSGKERYLCILCKRQFILKSEEKEMVKTQMCELCGGKMYVYMRDETRNIMRFRCSKYPLCKNYIVLKIKKEVFK